MILIALGANIPSVFGTPEETLVAAQSVLNDRGISVCLSSSIWISAPVPMSDQPWYRNAVVAVETDYEPLALLSVLKAIEVEFGRLSAERNAARPLDLDILAYHDEVLDFEGLHVPHPRMEGRAFVLYPLQEIISDWRHPVSGRDISSLIGSLSDGLEIKKIEGEAA